MAEGNRVVTVGVDTHKDAHVAAALDASGALLGTASFPADARGYASMVAWMRAFGRVEAAGVEGTGGYGAGLARALDAAGVRVLEVSAPDRSERRRRGKSDGIDAEQAARAALAGTRCAPAKSRCAEMGALGALEAAYAGAVKARTAALNALQAQVVALPEEARAPLRGKGSSELVRACASMRSGAGSSPETLAKVALRSLARRARMLDEEAKGLEAEIDALTKALAPSTRSLLGAGPHVAARLLLAAGANVSRLRSEASFSMLCGASPVPVSSGRADRHRLSRAGDRRANSALYTMAITRMAHDERTRSYVARRMSEGKTKKDAIRCLKRYIAREAYRALAQDMEALGMS